MKRAAVVYVLAAGALFVCSLASEQSASGQSASDPAPAEPPAAGTPSEPPLFQQPPSEPPSEPPPAAPPSEAPPDEPEAESPPGGDKRPTRLYQTNDGVSVLSNKAPAEPARPSERDAAPPERPPVEPRLAETTLEPSDGAPMPSARPLAPVIAAAPPSRAPLFLLAGAVGIVAIAIIAIFFRRK